MSEKSIIRWDLITLAYRVFLATGYIQETDALTVFDTFTDKNNISDYAKPAMESMAEAEFIKGSDSKVNPLGNATRMEVAVTCARLTELMD